MLPIPRRRRQASATQVRELDRRGYYRSPVTLAAYHIGKAPANKGRRFPPEPLTPSEVLALMEHCGRGACGKRDRALIAILWRCGLRVSEALALLPKDLDLDAGTVRVLYGKGDKSRTVGIDQMGCAVVREWMTERQALGLGARQPVFCVVSKPSAGKPMHAAYVRNKLHELGERADIGRRVHPHGLRHTHAFELAGERVDLRLIKQQLGHTSLTVTARYVEHLNPSELTETIRARSWPES